MNLKKSIQSAARKFFGLDTNSPRVWTTLYGDNDKHAPLNGFADAVLRAIVGAACNGELRLHTSDGEVVQYKKKGENLLLDLLYQPSPFFNENVFKQIIVSHAIVFGDIYILKDARDTRNRPTRLIPIPKPSISLKLGANGYPDHYEVHTKEGRKSFPLTDIIHIYEGNAKSLFEGQSRFKKCALDNDIMGAAKVFNLAFFRNGASVGGVISYPKDSPVKQEEAAEVVRAFNDMHQGSGKAHRWAALTQGATIQDFKTSHKDMEFAAGQRFAMQQIYSTMGVPPALVGLFEYAPQFNTKEQQKIFYETNIIPLMRLISDALSEELVPEFYPEEQYYIDYDFSQVQALKVEWNEVAAAFNTFAQYYPLNVVKNAMGLPFPDIDGGDEPPSPILSAFGLNAPKRDTKGVKKVREVRPSPAQMKRHKANKLALIDTQSDVMRKSIESHFAMQADLVRDWVAKNENKLFDYDAVFGDEATQRDLLLAVKVPALAEIYQAGIAFEQDYLQSLIPSKDYKFTDKKAMRDRVQEWAKLYAFTWADSIERTTFERLDKIISLGVDNGMSNLAINNLVLQFFSEEGYEPSMLVPNDNGTNISIYDRVKTIVQTETRATISEAQKEAFTSTPFVNGKGWITTMGVSDHHEGHPEMDGQEVKIEEDFRNPVTGQFTPAPGQFGVADQDINCLCDMYPVVIDEE